MRIYLYLTVLLLTNSPPTTAAVVLNMYESGHAELETKDMTADAYYSCDPHWYTISCEAGQALDPQRTNNGMDGPIDSNTTFLSKDPVLTTRDQVYMWTGHRLELTRNLNGYPPSGSELASYLRTTRPRFLPGELPDQDYVTFGRCATGKIGKDLYETNCVSANVKRVSTPGAPAWDPQTCSVELDVPNNGQNTTINERITWAISPKLSCKYGYLADWRDLDWKLVYDTSALTNPRTTSSGILIDMKRAEAGKFTSTLVFTATYR
ncbi:hypothetical protein [Serratia marcescens]|uniref:hypothetical protein n=1 Tax=Serratia marcescens TaxID=615 RepID=UPI00148E7BEC|nr:hypothetical protein [Serratia marcescens]QJU42282.1 hypothetical protein HMI62_24495 [Serratia marcescens]